MVLKYGHVDSFNYRHDHILLSYFLKEITQTNHWYSRMATLKWKVSRGQTSVQSPLIRICYLKRWRPARIWVAARKGDVIFNSNFLVLTFNHL